MKNILGKPSILLVIFMIFLMMVEFCYAQQFSIPRPSPNASVSQTVGLTVVKITYSSPGVKGRTIWGELVPFDKVWRTGANECTKISFSTDVMLNGQEIKAGEYSLFTIPSLSEWSVILNKNTSLWGAMGYKEEEDVLRIKVKPKQADFKERMSFSIEDMTNNSANIILHWEKIKVPFTLTVDTNALLVDNARKALNWQIPFQAASYCLTNNLDMEEGYNWVNVSISMNENYNNTSLKAQYLDKLGKKNDAIKTMEKALEIGKNMERTPRNYSQMENLLKEWRK